jgi:pimeloyl-ACP methyl ester carboxylesterase
VGIVVSESSVVRIFCHGQLVGEIIPELWMIDLGAVLDYFNLDHITLIGISLGGCLALRAAAYEPRVHRVVADDTDTDHLEVMLGLVKPSVASRADVAAQDRS